MEQKLYNLQTVINKLTMYCSTRRRWAVFGVGVVVEFRLHHAC
jgi:hypothetical protein